MPSKILSPSTRQNYGVYGSCPKGQSYIFVYVYILIGYLPNVQLKFLSLCLPCKRLEKWPHTTTAVNLNFTMILFFPYILKVSRTTHIQSNKQKLL